MKLDDIIIEVLTELKSAKAKHEFPTNPFEQLSVLSEKVGEVHQAVLDHKHKGAPKDNIRAELVQVAAMAIRTLENFENEPKTAVN